MAKLIKFVSSALFIIVLLFIVMPTNGYEIARMRYSKEKSGFVFDALSVQDGSEIPRRPTIETGDDME